MIYHITTHVDWEAARSSGIYQADTFAEEGFIHCSSRQQVEQVANRFYRGRQGLVLLAIEPDKVDAPLKWENLEGGQEKFPHIYGPLKLSAVAQVVDIKPGPGGTFDLAEVLANHDIN
jgi:uncharacterized protein (DUF952 family)